MARIYRFSYIGFDAAGVEYVNSWHYQTDLPGPTADEPATGDVINAIDGKLRTAYKNCLPSTITVNSAELREEVLPHTGAIGVADSLNINQPGTGGTDGKLPNAVTAIIKLRTDTASRSARGYVAMPSPLISTALSAAGRWTGTFAANLQTLAALFDDVMDLGLIDVTHLNPVVYSRTRRERGFEPYTFKVVEGIVRDKPSWRRSRMSAP
jgi:hypothetical protein